MEIVTEAVVAERLRALPGAEPRVVVSGNYATPWELVRILESSLPRCRAFVMNVQSGWPRRDGFVTETPFVGPGAREDAMLDYLPMRLSLCLLYTSLRRRSGRGRSRRRRGCRACESSSERPRDRPAASPVRWRPEGC